MIDKRELERGWRYVGTMNGGEAAAFVGHEYVMKVASAIDDLESSINAYAGTAKGTPQLGGEIAEEWAAKTFNIRAVAAESAHRAFVEKSTKHASVDVSTNFGEDYSLKYMKCAEKSIKAQAKNVLQNYHEYLSQAKANGTRSPMTFEEYLARYGYTDDLEDILMSVYRGQGRIIPSDQLEEGMLKLRQLIATEAARGGENRLLNLQNYQGTLQALSDRIRDGDGIESIPLSKDESHAIAELCKTNNFRPEDFGITLDSEITKEYILNQSLKGGITAATVTIAIQMVPILLEIISILVKEKKLNSSQLKEFGVDTMSAGTKGFIIGGLSCGIYTACKVGKFGANLSKASIIGTIVALAYNVMIESFDYTRGKEDVVEYKYTMTRDLIISGAAIAGGSLAVAVIPLANSLSFVIGSMLGSVMASVVFSYGEKFFVSFCANTGFTLFGLVKQDYKLSDDFFREMGLNLIDLRRIKPNEAKLSFVSLNRDCLSVVKPNTINIQILKRGLISFHTVGYIL